MAYEPITAYVKSAAKHLVFRKKAHRELVNDLIELEIYARNCDAVPGTFSQKRISELREKHPGAYEAILEEVNPESYQAERKASEKKLGILLPPLCELVQRLSTREADPYRQAAERRRAEELDALEAFWRANGGLV